MYEYRHLTPEQREELVLTRLKRGFPQHSPPHLVTGCAMYLLTATCYQHACYMSSSERRSHLLDQALAEFLAAGVTPIAWSVLPNHYHLLADSVDIALMPGVFQRIHGRTARAWNLEDGQAGRKVWYRYSDRTIRTERHLYTTLNYLHYNPVKHGWTQSPYDWKESSVQWYVEQFGRDWLRELWVRYPVRDYGRGWDEVLGDTNGS